MRISAKAGKDNLILSFLLALCLGITAQAQTNISGKSGLIYIPTAEQTDDGAFGFGYHYNPINYSVRYNRKNSEGIYFINLTIVPRLEININLLRINNEVNRGRKGIGDRQLDIKYLILKETPRRPSLAIFVSAPFGIDNSLSTNVITASKTIEINNNFFADITAGYGSPFFVERNDSEKSNFNIFSNLKLKKKKELDYQYLSGPIGGVKLRYAKIGGIMAEWDSQHINTGIYGTLFKRWTIQAGLLNFDQVTFGTSYAINLNPKAKRLQNNNENN